MCKELIDKLFKKMAETNKLTTKWPKEGTFDLALLSEKETLVKNYRSNNMGQKQKKREEKREREQKVLTLYKKRREIT